MKLSTLCRKLSWLCQQEVMRFAQEVKHSVQDDTVISKKTIVHFNFQFNFHERSELTSILTS